MNTKSRREFLADVGRGMMVASVGATLASEWGGVSAFASGSDELLTFGPLEPLVELMQETPIHMLQPLLVEKLKTGTSLQSLMAAGALANARTFGGQDYGGYHAMMAMMPAFEMTRLLPANRAPLPVLKVLYRNSDMIQKHGGRPSEVLYPIADAPGLGPADRERLRKCFARRDMKEAERVFARLSQKGPQQAFNDLQFLVREEIDVHQVVLAWRAWDTIQLTGTEHAHTLLRQSVRHCIDRERQRVEARRAEPEIRRVLPRVLQQHGLLSRQPGNRRAENAWIDDLSRLIFSAEREEAADAVGAALAEGIAPGDIAEAISLAANRLVLHDPGRSTDSSADKPKGSVHGASVGVHAQDSANAWRHIAEVTDSANTMASLVIAGYHAAGQQHRVGEGEFPFASPPDRTLPVDRDMLLSNIEDGIRAKDQPEVCSLVEWYRTEDHPPRPLFDLLLKYAISEDGALHAEKYFHTVREEFALTRPAFRWRHLLALARVTASEYGFPAPGRDQARELLKIT